MASYAALVSLESTLEKFIRQDQLQILDDEDTRRPFNLLKQNVALLLDFLDNSPASARQLEKKIGDSAYEAECIIENHVWEARFNGKVSVHVSNKLFLDIKNIATEIESIVRKAKEIESNAVGEDDSRSKDEPLSIPESGVHKNKDKVVGFDDELGWVKDRIFSNDYEMVTIPIVGMGGIGKTTLARAAFDDPAVIDHFDVRRWVTVSHIYDSRAILLAILDEKSSNETESLKDLSVEVRHLLHRRRYIIVVDDIWSSRAWDDIRQCAPDHWNGSRILLTTRDENVAIHATNGTTVIHHLSPLDKERSWRLLEERVFGEGGCCPPELLKLGETIVQGCEGLPLAIVVIADILSKLTPTPDLWEIIASDVNMVLCKEGEQLLEILSLSYHNLPYFLKQCFLYFGAFPKDHDIHVSNLIKLWVAEGFLKAQPIKLAEEIAYKCLDILTKRNLIMISKKRYNGEVKTCRIHSILRQLCIRQAQEEKFLDIVEDMMELGITVEGKFNARRISFGSRVSTQTMNPSQCSIHTALCFQHDMDLITKLLPCRLLRVLDITGAKYQKFPSELFQLYHLRYLAFTYKRNFDFELPRDICNLENLETLIAQNGPYLDDNDAVIIPPEIWKMTNLRHVILYSSVVLPDPISQRFPLENLLTLSKLYNFCCTAEVLHLIPNVRKIAVFYELDCEKENWYDYYLTNFRHFGNLESLRIELELGGYELDWCKRNPFMDCLVLPSSLRRLRLTGGAARIPWEDMTTTVGSLPNLEYLKLCHNVCSGDAWEIGEGDFENLRVLEIYHSDLIIWRAESHNHLPNLERLVLSSCGKLTGLPHCIGEIMTLQQIKVVTCSYAAAYWALSVEEKQRELGNDFLITEVDQVDQLRDLKKEDKVGDELGAVLQWLNLLGGGDKKKVEQRIIGNESLIYEFDQLREKYEQSEVEDDENLVEQRVAVLELLNLLEDGDKENKSPNYGSSDVEDESINLDHLLRGLKFYFEEDEKGEDEGDEV